MSSSLLQKLWSKAMARPKAQSRVFQSYAGPSGASVLLTALVSSTIALGFAASSESFEHWFVLPLVACGTLIGIEFVEWMRGRLGLFDPAGMVSILGFHGLFLAPLLLVFWNYRQRYVPDQPDDYREWLGKMALLNLFGLVIYRAVMAILRTRRNKGLRTQWCLSPPRFWISWTAATVLCASFEAWLWIRFGGLRGLLDSYSAWLAGQDSFQNMAIFFAVAESLPIVLLIGFIVYARKGSVGVSITVAVFVSFAILQMIVGGLRGSRSNVIWMIFWAVGLIHFLVRRVPRYLILFSCLLLYAFVSVYGAYKRHGTALIRNFETSGEYSSFDDGSEGAATVLVGDLSRGDVQANILYHLQAGHGLELAWGRSYVGAAAMLIPRFLVNERLPTVVRWTTDLEFGRGAFASGMTRSTRVYGIAGEAMLNFGPIGVLGAFAVLGAFVAGLQSFMSHLPRSDMRVLMVPFFINFAFLLLLDDSDNAVFYLVKYGLVPGLLVIASSRRVSLLRRTHGHSGHSTGS